MAPERLLVFEVRGPVASFVAAVRHVPGLELIDEEELESDDGDESPALYLMVPDVRALRDIEALWRRSQRGELARGETPWRDVFSLLRDLRPWGPSDRVQPEDASALAAEIAGRADEDRVRLEIELVFRGDEHVARERQAEVVSKVREANGFIVTQVRIEEIAYHALLAELPVSEVRRVIDYSPGGIAGEDAIMYIRPQSVATGIDVADQEVAGERSVSGPLKDPILAILDGVPVAAHRLLAPHLIIDDQFDLEPSTEVSSRIHGTAMASLIVHGDLNRTEPPLPRQVHVVPVLGPGDQFSGDRLIVDVVYQAVIRLREGVGATAPGVVIVNLSLGNAKRPFHGQLSAWARLLDRLAFKFGILFVVSAGNHPWPFRIPAFATHTSFEDATSQVRASETLRALGMLVADRRLLSPAETVNGLTIGASNQDAVPAASRVAARVNVDPYGELTMTNPSSALGPGFALSVKPDVLMPGSREHVRIAGTSDTIQVGPAAATRSAGLRVAAPPRAGRENLDAFTGGTSASAALASRTAHRIHDALEESYGAEFLRLAPLQRAVLLKALLTHPAVWPDAAAELIRNTIGPPEGKYHVRQRDNIRRFFGFGVVDGDDAIACAADRATFWATGQLQPNKIAEVRVPVPVVMGGKARPHSVIATLAWFTPIHPGRKSYRAVRLRLLNPEELNNLAVETHKNQPDFNQSNRGTVISRRWSGARAPVVPEEMTLPLIVQRDPDQGPVIDEAIPFGLAVTLTMPGVETIYEQVMQRLRVVPRPQA